MIDKLFKGIFTCIGLALGFILGKTILKLHLVERLGWSLSGTISGIIFIIINMIIFGVILFLASPLLIKYLLKVIEYVEKYFQKIPTSEIVFGTIGAIIGLLISTLFFSVVKETSLIWNIIAVVVTIALAIIGADIAKRKKDDIMNLIANTKKSSGNIIKEKKTKNLATPKILDTSVIIDGRILDICQTGFVEGTLVIPQFVLDELRHIADSSDDLKRNRGRRGLDILNKIQNDLIVPVEISEVDFPDINEVDSKLLKLAQVMNGKVLTNDFNLNKVAQFQGVSVLNINELANAIKPVLLPGEEMKIQIIKDGKESGQGIAYLDDGTMIVVEGAKKCIGEHLDVVVTSVLQTAAGRMIFAKRKDNK